MSPALAVTSWDYFNGDNWARTFVDGRNSPVVCPLSVSTATFPYVGRKSSRPDKIKIEANNDNRGRSDMGEEVKIIV